MAPVVGALIGWLKGVAALVATRPSGPPQPAIFLPAFWMLVPGAAGRQRARAAAHVELIPPSTGSVTPVT